MSKTHQEANMIVNAGTNEANGLKCSNNSNCTSFPVINQANTKRNRSYASTHVLSKKGKRQVCEGGNDIKLESNSSWTEQEELNLIIAHKEHKNRWSDVSEALKGKSNNSTKNRFYSIFRKVKAKIQKDDFTYLSLIELLEMHYMTNMIEQYLSKPNPNARLKGKRGKDFIYSLIHNLDLTTVKEYNSKLTESSKEEGTLDDLFEKLSTTYQAQKIVSAEEARKPKNELPIQPISFEFINPPTQKIDDFLCCQSIFPLKEEIHSPLFRNAQSSPSLLFSPTALSAGPAAAAANFAACFYNKQPHLKEGFAEYTNELHVKTEDLPSTFLTIRCHPQFI